MSPDHNGRNTSLYDELQEEVSKLFESGAVVIILDNWNSCIRVTLEEMDLEEVNHPWPFTIPQRFNIHYFSNN